METLRLKKKYMASYTNCIVPYHFVQEAHNKYIFLVRDDSSIRTQAQPESSTGLSSLSHGRMGRRKVTCDPSQLAFVEVSNHTTNMGSQADTNDVD
jgi:hypothetical protein